ncbi:MAG: DNA methyltransferase [Candidatus Infernicultor aquiphilus]|uniref:site-specific DNA-methyltransferase (adenine-specific) n=1 Tax=Candidatus Infernicultor aquiphilus TaxID=1805029 RepID=A0A1J5GS87_9BACT|nr:SAM-dependent DNA methyltransferase [bacterium]OIP71471.1 MAG: DNA methyltransferase [Candidatus Atribacteria bacterium CG2_30_33_13]PIU25772.1 MAG: DNA methyltransferase [Candidatus Atribacteria bacterium CG08_land_8_20_14_0_20_33_29]PIX33776.1 MAG: DNA methyltransferase [Candidatus Atribacteria bacterium CG_4_8_14_3_um_filter_34_18]PIY32926.1 MAG: DNA methyltransferase [Candidatus Atribacteria bacterium CG_4_10_14_3_um_filter_34_13]PJB57342.1 MAG: DNA methyltransferase [Candidatus Atribac
MNTDTIISRVWSFSTILRDDGVTYGDYLEQLTYLIFLKMADEYSKPPYNRDLKIPERYNWQTLIDKKGVELETHYLNLLKELGKESGLIGQIFVKAQNKIQDPAKLYRIIQMINSENWAILGVDVKGTIYEGLLEKNAEDLKSGAGQYFTPRVLIKAMVECIKPEPIKTIADPACGTGGFFLAAYDFISNPKNYSLNQEQKEFLKFNTFRGWELVSTTYRLCLMNLFLHNIGDMNSMPPITRNDALIADPGERFDYILTNPPFGKKSSMTFTNEEGRQEKEDLVYNRQDFWTTTSNKQLNFVQHVRTLLKTDGKAAVVVPDNVLFEGGAGETVRKKMLETTDLHTILRLPTGIFYKPGVKANVIFFDNHPADKNPWTKEVWIYDLRTNMHFTLKENKMEFEDLKNFIECYNPENRHGRKEAERFRKFTYNEIVLRDKTSLDIFWLKDNSLTDLDNLPDPDALVEDIIENLESSLESLREISNNLNKE